MQYLQSQLKTHTHRSLIIDKRYLMILVCVICFGLDFARICLFCIYVSPLPGAYYRMEFRGLIREGLFSKSYVR